jgi:curved DNA-binding protein CbpA
VNALEDEISQLHAKLSRLTHYEVLGVAKDAAPEAVRRAYLELAKRWHADRLSQAGISPQGMAQAEDIFRRAGDANRILLDPEERKSYDWVSSRKDAGLPTEAATIVEAEGLFHRAEGLIRRGQAAQAEPMLRKAVAANRGEGEYWAYLGYAVFCVQGAAGRAEAKKCFDEALRLSPKLDVTYEFMGRVSHTLGEAEAQGHLQKALALNPKNVSAQRELRLLHMRATGTGNKTGAKNKPAWLMQMRKWLGLKA